MSVQVITERDDLVITRRTMAPGEATEWHTDACERFTVVVRGEQLTIEFLNEGDSIIVPVAPGLADWDQPEARVHRAVNSGRQTYEEIVTFYRDDPTQVPQPSRA